jgi:hypothetical protein
VVAWGYNNRGQLGNGGNSDALVPADLRGQGALAGKAVAGIGAGGAHSVARCADGTLAAWGYNHRGQLGVTGMSQSRQPVAVVPGGGTVAALVPGGNHNLLRLAGGGLLAWGDNTNGQLGDNTTAHHTAAASVDTSALAAEPVFMFADSGASAQHSLAVVALPGAALSALESWRQAQFGSPADSGDGANLNDFDRDGIPNLVEYAFGLDPRKDSSGQLPQARLVAGEWVLSFTQPAGMSDIVYGAEWSPTLQAGTWQAVPDTGSGNDHRFAIQVAGAPQGFMRLKVMVR